MSRGLARASVLGLSICLCSVSAYADSTGFALNQFDPAERGSDWFSGESLDLRGHMRPAVGLVTDWAHDPLVFRNPDGSERSALISNAVYAHVGGDLTLWDRVRIGLNVPIAVYQSGQGGQLDGATYSPSTGTAFGDIRLGADVRLVGEYGQAFTLALGAQAYIPTGSRDSYTSDGSFRIAPRLLAAGRLGVFGYSARVGAVLGPSSQFAGNEVGTEVMIGATAGLIVLHDHLVLGPELFGSTGVGGNTSAFSVQNTPLEALGGAHYLFGYGLRAGAGVGAGITAGYGSPLLRVVASLEWAPEASKRPAPPLLEPPPPEPVVVADRDEDGVPDIVDACPNEKGVDSTDPRRRGCPPLPDRDGDTIADAVDACPDSPGVATNNPRTHGCPPDQDSDGIVDANDACPREPGPPNDDPAKNGCPRAVLANHRIRILEQIRFRTASAELDPASDVVLGDVFSLLEAHPEVRRLSIEGHTDNSGSVDMNRRLSVARAASVERWLVRRGVAASRLESRGFGDSRPLVSNENEEGRRSNRRVEFIVLDEPGSAQALR